MPVVPRYEGMVKSEPLRVPNAQPEAFGGGQVARAVGQVGDALTRMRQESEQLMEDAADVELGSRATSLLQEFSQLRGDAAVRGSEGVLEKFNAEAQRVMAAMTPDQRERFKIRQQRQEIQLRDRVASHAIAEEGALWKSTNEAILKRTVAEGAEAARDGGDVDESVAAVRQRMQAMRTSQFSPWRSDEEADLAETEMVSATRAAQISALFANEQTGAAVALLDRAVEAGELTEQDRAQLQEGKKRASEAARLNDAITRIEADPTKANDIIAGLKDGDGNIDVTLQRRVRDELRARTKALAEQEDAAAEELMRRIDLRLGLPENRGKSIYAILTREEIMILGDKRIDSLQASINSFDDSAGMARWYATVSSAEGRAEVLTWSMAQLQQRVTDHLTPGNREQVMKEFVDMRAAAGIGVGLAGGSGARGPNATQSLVSDADQQLLYAQRYGIAPMSPVKDWTDEQLKLYNDFRLYANAELLRQQPKTDVERTAIIQLAASRALRMDKGKKGVDARDTFAFYTREDYRTLLTPEQRMAIYAPQAQLDEVYSFNAASEPQTTRKYLLNLLKDIMPVTTESGAVRVSDFTLMQMKAALDMGDTEKYQQLVELERKRLTAPPPPTTTRSITTSRAAR